MQAHVPVQHLKHVGVVGIGLVAPKVGGVRNVQRALLAASDDVLVLDHDCTRRAQVQVRLGSTNSSGKSLYLFFVSWFPGHLRLSRTLQAARFLDDLWLWSAQK